MAGRMVEYASNGGRSQGYLSTPASGSGPGVVVIQEWWGLAGRIKDVADRLQAKVSWHWRLTCITETWWRSPTRRAS